MNFFKKYSKWAAAFLFAVAVITVYKTFDNLSNITKAIGMVFRAISPFFWGFVIAYVLNLPAVRISKLFQKARFQYVRNHSEGLSILCVYLLTFGILIWVILALFPMLYRNILDLYNSIPTYVSNAIKYLSSTELFGRINFDWVNLNNAISGIFEKIDIKEFGKYAQGVFNFTSGFIKIFIAVISSIYMLLDKGRITKGIKRVVSVIWGEEKASSALVYAGTVNRIFTNYIYSRLVCCVVMAVVCSLVLSLLRVKYAVILGIFIGVMDMIPYFGSIISSVLATAITLVTGGWFKGIYTGVSLLVLQQLDGNLLAPKVMGDSLEIRPLVIIIAVTVGSSLFGFMGMLLSVPVAAILKILFSGFIREYETRVRSAE